MLGLPQIIHFISFRIIVGVPFNLYQYFNFRQNSLIPQRYTLPSPKLT
jgi:hypothetical protein